MGLSDKTMSKVVMTACGVLLLMLCMVTCRMSQHAPSADDAAEDMSDRTSAAASTQSHVPLIHTDLRSSQGAPFLPLLPGTYGDDYYAYSPVQTFDSSSAYRSPVYVGAGHDACGAGGSLTLDRIPSDNIPGMHRGLVDGGVPDTTLAAGLGVPDGNIFMKVGGVTVMTFYADGGVDVRGHRVASDIAVYQDFKLWLRGSTYTAP
jgi:hypothetical protein